MTARATPTGPDQFGVARGLSTFARPAANESTAPMPTVARAPNTGDPSPASRQSFASSGVFDLPLPIETDLTSDTDTARALVAISPSWEVLYNSEDTVHEQVRTLRDIIGALREAAQAMDSERTELRSFLDGSKDAIERLEDWAGQAMGLDLRQSPEQVRRYLPLSVVWVTTTRLKKLVTLLNTAGRRLSGFHEDIDESLQNLHVALDNVGRIFSSVARVSGSTQGNGANGGFTATVAQVTQVQFQPQPQPISAPSPLDYHSAPYAPSTDSASASLPPGARAEIERSVRDDLRRELEDEVRGEIAASVREEETTRLRHELEIQVRRQMLAELSPGLGATSPNPDPLSTGHHPAVVASTSVSLRTPQPARVTEQTAETLEVFREEAEEHLRNIALGIRQLEANPGDKAALQSVRRATHTLKGAAGMMGFSAMEQLSHASEDLLDRLVEDQTTLTASVQGLLLDTSEALEQIAAQTSSTSDDTTQLVHALQLRYARVLGTAMPVPMAAAELVPTVARNSAQGLDGEVSTPGATDGNDADLTVRLRLSKLDEIINLFGDLLQNRSVLEERLGRLTSMVGDTSRASERLRDIGTQLESRFEAATLPSGPSSGRSALPMANPGLLDRTLGGLQSPAKLPSGAAHFGEFDALELDRYTEFHRLSRGLSESVADMATLSTEMESIVREIESVFARETRLSSSFQDRLLKARLVPLQLLIPRLYRATRATAIKQGKDVEFLVEGDDTEVDRTVYEEVAGPLLHLVRNAVAHGIESPALRMREGKSPKGQIILAAFEQGNQVIITIKDDGAGVDPARVTAAAMARGLVSPTTVLTQQQALSLMFQPGLSTAETIDEESGRGVGLDVVKDTISRMRGTVEVDSTLGRGTTFTLRIPVSLQITRAVLVRVGQQTFGIPMTVVETIGRLDYYERVSGSSSPALEVRGAVYPLAHLASYLGQQPGPIDQRSAVLLFNSGTQRMALIVDAIPGRQEIVVKTLGPHLRDVRGIAGATVLGDGKVVLLLNMQELLARAPRQSITLLDLPSPNASIPRMPAIAPQPFGTGALHSPEAVARINTGMLSRNPPPPPSRNEVPTERLNGSTDRPPEMAPATTPKSLPFAAADPAPTPLVPRRPGPAPRNGYLLVVDDSPSVRRVVGNMLKANGWEVQTARDGIEAVEAVGRQLPAAVLLDIEMPRMDGYELMATLRSQALYRNLPLIVLTSRAATKHQQRALQLGADAYVVKPYQDEELLSTLDGLIARQHA
jgi:chemotaxis protein histidine kinase CheA/CheY-like chemotaxis protein